MASVLRPFTNILNPGSKQVPPGSLRIDWTHQLSKGLIGCWVPGFARGFDLTGQVRQPLVRFTNEPRVETKPEGPGLVSDVQYSNINGLAPSIYKTWTEFSLYWRGFLPGAPGMNSWPLGVAYDISPLLPPYALCCIAENNGTGTYNSSWNTGGTITSLAFSRAYSAGLQSIGLTLVVNGTVTNYQNGYPAGTSSYGASGPTSTATSQITINGWWYGPERRVNGACYIACFWNRALSAAEMASIDQNPYRFLLPAESEMSILFIPSAPPSILYGHNIGASFTRKVTTIGY